MRAEPFSTIDEVATFFANTSAQAERGGFPQALNASRVLKLWHLTSLDAPTVAVTWAWAFAWAARVHLPAWWLLLLGLAVWAVYIGDRLMDARAGLRADNQQDLRERHYFHWRHRRVLGALAAACAVTGAWIVHTRLTAVAVRRDSLVGLATLAYFSGVHARVKLPRFSVVVSREFLVGVLFSAGCALPVWSVASGRSIAVRLVVLPAAYFAALAWLNVRAITQWEAAPERRAGMWLGAVSCGLALAGVALAGLLAFSEPREAGLVVAGVLSALLVGALHRSRNRFDPLTLRALVDLVLLTPLVLVSAAALLA